MKINLNTFLIVAGFAVLFWLMQCNKPVSNTTVTSDTTHVIDHTTHTTTAEQHHWHETERVVYIPAGVDTADPAIRQKIVMEYFSKYDYLDSIVDSNISAKYSGTIWKNSMFNPKFEYKILRPQTIITNTTIHPAELRNKIYLGGFLSFRNPDPAVGALMSFQDKRERILTIGYGTGPTYFIGAQWKISFRRQGKPP
jgi:hypothetical protein